MNKRSTNQNKPRRAVIFPSSLPLRMVAVVLLSHGRGSRMTWGMEAPLFGVKL